ncbi:hypothetical protein BC938DRAFT_477585, partial [Jimgerdemannia flammicorona]
PCSKTSRHVIMRLYYGDITSNVTLKSICTSSRSRALAQYYTNITQKCQGASLNLTGLGEPVTYLVDIVWNSFNKTCLTPQLVNSARSTSNPPTNVCLVVHHDWSPGGAELVVYPNFLRCEVEWNNFNPIHARIQYYNLAKCNTGVQYTVKTGDTCFSISQNKYVATAQLVGANALLNWACNNIAVGMKLCLPS